MTDHKLKIEVDAGDLRWKVICYAPADADCKIGEECMAQDTLNDLGPEAFSESALLATVDIEVDTSDPEEVWVKLA